MALEITGRIIAILPETSGQGQNGTWIKQNFVIETKEQYPKKVCFIAWNDKTDILKQLSINDNVNVSFNPESREYNEKWYTDLKAWKIAKIGNNVNNAVVEQVSNEVEKFEDDGKEDNLPF